MRDYKAFFKGKKITLMGLGLLGRGVGDAKFLAECGADLIVTDLKSESDLATSLATLKSFSNITYHLGAHNLADFKDRDMVIKAAGVPQDSLFIAEAHKNNIPVRMSADLFAELSEILLVGITGTRGKSTTTHLIAHILKQAGKEVLLGGNVQGVSTLSLLPQVTQNTIAVLELDSWQLQGFGGAKMSPHVAVFTTFMADHMNYYKNDMQKYFADKANIFLNQNNEDFFILGAQVVPYIEEYGYTDKLKAQVVTPSTDKLPQSWVLRIPGEHNRYDAGLAVAVAEVFGLDQQLIRAAVESFTGVAGRLELIKQVRGVDIYNDTTATVPDATVVALRAVGKNKNVVLIMGGADKGLDMNPLLNEIPTYCKKVLLLAGSGTERIKSALPGAGIYQNFAQAVTDAFASAESGDILLLSPAFASFGMFKNEYDRGDQFNAIVAALN